MAYLDLDNMFAAPGGARAAAAAPIVAAPATPGFSALEWSVIALARRDTLRSLAGPSRLSRAMGSLFGLGGATMLADARLEALRRLAVHAWRRGFALPAVEIDRFLAAGFIAAQIETLVESVTGMRVGAASEGARGTNATPVRSIAPTNPSITGARPLATRIFDLSDALADRGAEPAQLGPQTQIRSASPIADA